MTSRALPALALSLLLTAGLAGCATNDPGTPAPTGTAAIAVDPPAQTLSAEDVSAQIIGMNSSDAQNVVESNGYTWRVGEIDGQPQAVTMDYRPDRITVALSDDIVTAAVVG